MKKVLLILVSILLFSCSNRTHETKIKTEFCLVMDFKDKIICMDAPIDTTADYLFIQDNYLNQRYSNLVVNYMMVVDIKYTMLGTKVILSNPQYSIEVSWVHTKLPEIEEMFYIISNEKFLRESVLLQSGIDITEDAILDDTEYIEP